MSRDTYFQHDTPAPELERSGDSLKAEAEPLHMRTEVYYSLGGPNYFSGGMTKRGIWLSFTPVRLHDHGYTAIIGDDRGGRLLLEELARKNKKRGEAWAAIIGKDIDRIAAAAIAQQWAQIRGFLLGSNARSEAA